MDSEEFVVRMTVSDPWEFTDPTGDNVFDAAVQRVATDSERSRFPLLLRLRHGVKSTAVEGTRYFVATSHDPGEDYARLAVGEAVDCRVTGISEDQTTGPEPLDVSGWRGRYPAARVQLQLP